MKGNLNFIQILLCFVLITGIPFGSMAADKTPMPPSIKGIILGQDILPAPVPVTPPGNDGLLSGMTPGNYKMPSGWSLIKAQDFENGCGSGEYCNLSQGSINSTRPHTGSKSLGGTYSADQNSVGWHTDEGIAGSFTEIYLSFYEWIDSSALFNDEFFLARFAVNSGVFQEVLADWYWAPGFNKPSATLYIVPQGQRSERLVGKSATVPTGKWVQWEIHYRPNTPGNSNGFFRIYKDGSLFVSAENADVNSTVSMANCSVSVGGVYTKLVWMKDYPTCTVCSSSPGDGTDYCMSSKNWWGQSFSNPKCSPKDPPLPSFQRFIDDIILIKK